MINSNIFKPTRAELEAAKDKTVEDIIAPGLKLLFCGVNPGLYTAAIGHHFGHPGNKFWKVLYLSGFTHKLYTPYEEDKLIALGYGITNIVNRATSRADELTEEELVSGAGILTEKIIKYYPKWAAIVGIEAYRKSFRKPKAKPGLQNHTIRETKIWLLPNPSGLNAHYSLMDFVNLFKELKNYTVKKDLQY